MSADQTDRNLLFGVLALQADLLDAARFAEACSAWATRKDTPLADLLLERGWLTPEDRAHLDYLLQRKLQMHAGAARASLAVLLSHESLRRVLTSLDDPAIRQSLAALPAASSQPASSTAPPQPADQAVPPTVAPEAESRERYTLTRLHGKGGIGQVWLARDA